MSDIKKLIDIVHEAAKEFGAVFPEDKKEKPNIVVNAIERNVIDIEKVNVRFYAIIDETQPTSGVYSGLSFVIFPDSEGERCIVSIACGTGGIENDSELASLPGLRRGVLRIQKQHNKEYKDKGKPVMSCKRNFTDIENKIKFTNAKNDKNFKAASKEYGKYILASQEVFINEEESVTILKAWLALYAKYREWGKDDNISSALDRYYKGNDDTTIIQTEISKLLSRRKFVVLQGAPGTGKTWIASKIAKEGLDDNIKFSEIIFTQFHAETTYTDFISGIIPAAEKKDMNVDNKNSNCVQGQENLDKESSRNVQLKYVIKKGALCLAIEAAIRAEKQGKAVLLIIDEINRANLSNVLGEAFYLFEADSSDRENAIIVGGEPMTKLPDNLYVLATMNTSDRSLAVIDFALRRRFAWYTLKPIYIEKKFRTGKKFHSEYFKEFDKIFEKYATDSELSLQPGQAYFITSDSDPKSSKDEMDDKLRYELMPLIKEYLQEGLLSRAENDFSDLFFRRLSLNLYE